MVIPVIKITWLIFYFFGYLERSFYFIGHSFEYDALLMLLSFMFKHCLWHKILILGCALALLFEYLQVEYCILLNVDFLDFSYFLIAVSLIATLTFFINGRKIKNKTNIGIKGTDK